MRVEVNGLRLFVDSVGSKLTIADNQYIERPSLIVVHGGPGFDHSVFRPYYDRFADIAQVIYIDLAGHGRSDLGDAARWNLKSWGQDIRGVCDALEIAKPIVAGVSFGGFVAMSYATQYPEHPAGLILASTAARTDMARKLDAFERAGGSGARDAAERFWSAPTPENVAVYQEVCMPLYAPPGSDVSADRVIMRLESFFHFSGTGREMMTYDLRDALGRVQCPVMLVSGGLDPMTPPADLDEIAQALPPGLGRMASFAHAGHGVERTDPAGYERAVRDFLSDLGDGVA